MPSYLREDDPRLFPRSFKQRKAWQKYRKLLVQSAKEHNLEIPPQVWNGVRNAWFDGYWSCYEMNKSVFDNEHDYKMRPV